MSDEAEGAQFKVTFSLPPVAEKSVTAAGAPERERSIYVTCASAPDVAPGDKYNATAPVQLPPKSDS